jgi:transposase
MEAPNRLDFTPEEIDALIIRLDHKCLQPQDYDLLTDILRAMVWLSFSLKEKELSIARLRKIFGIKTESAKKLMALAKGQSGAQNQSQGKNKEKNKSSEEDGSQKPKNHGHRPSTDYTQARVIEVAHHSLKKGSQCPGCMKGRLFSLKPGTVLRIVGQPWLQVEIYRPERLRCSLCGKTFTANLPLDVMEGSRADMSAKAIVTLLKYRGGVPFYRQEQLQDILQAPISASEIWEMTEEVADALQPIYSVLCKQAAEADLLYNDDTKAKILSRMQDLKNEEDPQRTGTFTTCILAVNSDIKISLFFTGSKHAGENLDELLTLRPKNQPAPIQECDALSHNIPKNHDTVVSNCLAHLRRKFYELVETWPKEVTTIIGEFANIFANEKAAPIDDKERLKWHQEKSAPVMERIKKYCNSLINEKRVEPNSSMGKAIAYLNNHWEGFTLFLRIPGVPLTNNDAERLIKRVVLNRKNAYFFRNETGAKIADILMSVMETCVLNQVNPYNFLIAIQQYQADVRLNPRLWVPWIYEKRLKEITQEAIPPQ